MLFCQGNVMKMSGNFEPTQMWQPCTCVHAVTPPTERLTHAGVPTKIHKTLKYFVFTFFFHQYFLRVDV